MLGDQYGKVLEAGDLKLQFDAAAGTFHVAYYDQRFPARCAQDSAAAAFDGRTC